ncbi:hypothetical protein E0Z10_g2868 [Xylaria hypoxylon]|uniref:Protein kinase domain-containing protein n=1 Tax=Xylaria hypoxylon TaxID=37992 RepID=A0A4Z0Z0Z4_9PEZI|nr:hypothetical protein E0Z10_g2868 [Xylaria hypoxylon]
MSGNHSPRRAQGLRDLFYENFGNYRRGITWNDGPSTLRDAFQPISAKAPVIYMPASWLYTRQQPFRLYHQDRINIDTLEDIRDMKGLQDSFASAWRDLQQLKSYIVSQKERKLFRYQRCLGWGGNGLAAAFDVLDQDGRKVRGVVVKTLFNDDKETLENEVDALKKHARCEHIVQLEYVDGEGVIDKDKEVDQSSNKKRKPLPTGRKSPSPPPPMTIILELLENGDLASFIIKVRAHNEKIPNRVLWSFLLCLIRMCIGLAYPPDRIESYNSLPGPITETVPHYLKDKPARIVHFDMDPNNIFVGGLTGEEHQMTPILKLGDFGMATEILDDQHDMYYEHRRHWGKRGFFAPEQFCADWDYITRDRNLIKSHPIAGNYHWHTNVWGLGMYKETYWTYGAHIANGRYDHVDKLIQGIILRCQANFPEDRPRLGALEEFVLSNMNKGYPEETDLDIVKWVHQILYEVPLPPDETELAALSPMSSDGPPGTIGTGPKNPPTPVFFPQGIGIDVPPGQEPPLNPVAPPPRDPEPPAGSFEMSGMSDSEDGEVMPEQGGFLGVGGGHWVPSQAVPAAPNPTPTGSGPAQLAARPQST